MRFVASLTAAFGILAASPAFAEYACGRQMVLPDRTSVAAYVFVSDQGQATRTMVSWTPKSTGGPAIGFGVYLNFDVADGKAETMKIRSVTVRSSFNSEPPPRMFIVLQTDTDTPSAIKEWEGFEKATNPTAPRNIDSTGFFFGGFEVKREDGPIAVLFDRLEAHTPKVLHVSVVGSDGKATAGGNLDVTGGFSAVAQANQVIEDARKLVPNYRRSCQTVRE